MYAVELNEQERQVLVELVEREIPSLRDEIWHTDVHEYREFLKARERLLKALVGKLQGSAEP